MRKQKILFFIGLLLIFSSYFSTKYFTINLTDSVPKGIYILLDPISIQKGDYIVFNLPKHSKEYIYKREYLPTTVTTLIKKIGADELDRISIKETFLYINNALYGEIKKYDNSQLLLPELSLEELQPLQDEVLPLAENSSSFDGRYFGKISKKDILYKAKPILLF